MDACCHRFTVCFFVHFSITPSSFMYLQNIAGTRSDISYYCRVKHSRANDILGSEPHDELHHCAINKRGPS